MNVPIMRLKYLALEERRIHQDQTVVSMGQNENAAILYFFHGSGCTGMIMKSWLKKLCKNEFLFPHIKVIFPTAPLQSYQLNANRESTVWFDREALTESSNEKKESVNEICNEMLLCIEEEVTKGTPYNKIILGGFSMGGALALHLAYRFNIPFAGCFAISSLLNHDSQVYESLEANRENQRPPLLLFHGWKDALVSCECSKKIKKNLEDNGVNVTLKQYYDTDHEINKEQVATLREWLLKLLPPP